MELLITHCSLLIAHYSLLITHCSLLITHCSLLIAHYSLLIAHCSLLITHCSLLTADRSELLLQGGIRNALYQTVPTCRPRQNRRTQKFLLLFQADGTARRTEHSTSRLSPVKPTANMFVCRLIFQEANQWQDRKSDKIATWFLR